MNNSIPLTGTLTRRLQLKEQASDSISVLEGALQLKKDFYVHTVRTLDLLAADAAANGETESSTAGLRISADELHCQVSGGRGGGTKEFRKVQLCSSRKTSHLECRKIVLDLYLFF